MEERGVPGHQAGLHRLCGREVKPGAVFSKFDQLLSTPDFPNSTATRGLQKFNFDAKHPAQGEDPTPILR